MIAKIQDLYASKHIASLFCKLQQKITMEIIDLEDERGEAKGTRVVFGVPV